jgi:hypothetical protein
MQLTYMNPPTGYVAPEAPAYQEYPKWLHFPDSPSVLVNDADEEAAVMSGAPAPEPVKENAPPAPIPTLVGGNDERSMLLKIAEERGIRVDGRWGTPKLRKAVEAASQQ